MAACSVLKGVNIHGARSQPAQLCCLGLKLMPCAESVVYEAKKVGNSYKRISCFDVTGARRTLHVLYGGRMHYDALIP